MADRPSLFALWAQARDEMVAEGLGADPTPRYLELLREHGHVVPADHPTAGGRNLPCGWPGERAEDLDGVRLAAAEAYPDDEAQGELVVLRRADLLEYLGRHALPTEGDSAAAAQGVLEWLEAHRL